MDYHPTDPSYEVTELTRLLDGLILSFEEATTAQRSLEDWDEQNHEPPQPPWFEGANELLEHRRSRQAYLRDRAMLVQQRDASWRNFREKADEVARWLPQGSSMAHQHRGRRYEIGRITPGDASTPPVSVNRID
jgi:hypothetical protein